MLVCECCDYWIGEYNAYQKKTIQPGIDAIEIFFRKNGYKVGLYRIFYQMTFGKNNLISFGLLFLNSILC